MKRFLVVVKADDALIFSKPRDVKVTGRSISLMTVVAVMTDVQAAILYAGGPKKMGNLLFLYKIQAALGVSP